MKIQWERLDSNFGQVCRSKVPGGWLVFLFEVFTYGGPYGGFPQSPQAVLTFYPDAEHEWKPEKGKNGTKEPARRSKGQ